MTVGPEARLAALLSALDKLPPYDGLSYRGYTSPQQPVRPRAIVSPTLVATSLDPRVATENFSAVGIYAVIGRRGRDLSSVSRHPAEREVVFRPGSMFLPIELFDVDGLQVAIVEELDPDFDLSAPPQLTLEELKDQMRRAITDARSRPEVEPTSPGKFLGPLT